MAAGLLSAVAEKGRQQELLDAALNGLESLLSNTPVLESVRQRVIAGLPKMVQLYRGEPVVMNKVVEMTTELIAEVRADPAHPMRTELDAALAAFIARSRDSPEPYRSVDAVRLDLLSRPKLAELAAQAWQDLRDFLERVRAPKKDRCSAATPRRCRSMGLVSERRPGSTAGPLHCLAANLRVAETA